MSRSISIIGFVIVAFAMYSVTARVSGSDGDGREGDPPAVRDGSFQGRQILVILVGSSSCRFSSDPRARNAFWNIVRAEKARESDSVTISTVGISIDKSASAGLETLRAIGNFDEYSVGNGWLGNAALHYIVRDLSGVAMVPQILVVSRSITKGTPPVVGDDSVHVRLTGTDQMERWAQRLAAPKDS